MVENGIGLEPFEVDEAIREAIESAIIAGVFWRASRYNKASAGVWEALAEPHHKHAEALVNEATGRLVASGFCGSQ